MTRKLTTIIALMAALCLTAHAQVAHVLEVGAPGAAQDVYLPSAAYPTGGATFFGVEPLPASGILAPALRSGGMTINQVTSTVYSSDGVIITFDYNPLYAPFTPPPPLPLPALAPALMTSGPITGLALDTTTGILWMTDGLSFGGFTPLPPFVSVTPIIPITFTVPGTAGLTGLDIDSVSGTLWGCDFIGNVYNFTTAGIGVGPQPVATVPLPATSAGLGGLCINRTNGPPAVPKPFCSTQTIGYRICVTDGPSIYDGLIVANPAIPNTFTSGTPARGLAFSSDFQIMPGAVFCPSTFTFPKIGLSKAAHNGTGGANAFRLIGGPPLTTALLLYDFCPIPGGLFIPASGETLWINPLSSTFGFGTFVTDPFGDVVVPIGFSFALAGIQYSMQWAIFDVLAPLGYCLSDGMTWTIGDQ